MLLYLNKTVVAPGELLIPLLGLVLPRMKQGRALFEVEVAVVCLNLLVVPCVNYQLSVVIRAAQRKGHYVSLSKNLDNSLSSSGNVTSKNVTTTGIKN